MVHHVMCNTAHTRYVYLHQRIVMCNSGITYNTPSVTFYLVAVAVAVHAVFHITSAHFSFQMPVDIARNSR